MQIICIYHMKHKFIFLLILPSLFLPSCQKQQEENIIYTSFYPLYDFTKRIVGDKFDVFNITPYGSEPHDYEPKAKEIVKMTKAKAVFIHGLELENYASSLTSVLKKKVHIVSNDISTLNINNTVDPHTWLSIPKAIKEMENITNIICDIDKENENYYKANFNTAKESFLSLDKEYREKIQTLNNKYLVVSHAAFGYLCDEYGLTQVYVSGLSPDEEPTAKGLENIIEKVKEYNVSTIFYEELVSDEISKKIASETSVKVEVLNPLEGISKEDEENGKDYLSIMKENLDKIMEALHD